ncbi:MAG: phosphoribosylamine--glycine ligase [Polyangiaceae bacterium]|nr:phosphoribosylamine--glycine ligase [Polyangiaceae bacterium]
MTERRTVLILGSGAREHALATKLAASDRVEHVWVAPGNGGTAREHENVPLARVDDPAEVVRVARELSPDLIVVGPEAPLAAGCADALRDAGFLVFGPGRDGARLEGSKAYFKEFAARHRLPTAACATFTDAAAAHAHLDAVGRPLVVKADGLCAGKGVVVPATLAEAHDAVDAMLTRRELGAAGATIVLEEPLRGYELSVHILTDGRGYLIFPPAQDHKRIFDGDRGPNTGGMGAYAPAPTGEGLLPRIEAEIVRPTIHGLFSDGVPFRGVLFAGLMITEAGDPMLLEYNVRFGDPETEVLMAIADEDVLELFTDVARGELARAGWAATSGFAATVVLAAEGYPGKPSVGDEIAGVDAAGEIEGVFVLHAGTRREGDRLVTSGGRVLAVTATADTLPWAVSRAYEGVACVSFRGMQHRRDIARRPLEG